MNLHRNYFKLELKITLRKSFDKNKEQENIIRNRGKKSLKIEGEKVYE